MHSYWRTLLTLLEQINEILLSIGESPINTVEGPIPTEAALALSIVTQTSQDVQRSGWAFNTDADVVLTPDNSGRITVPESTVRIVFDESRNAGTMPVLRGRFVYDRKNNTYTFTQAIQVKQRITQLEWDFLPAAAQRYIGLRSARVFVQRMKGESELRSPATDEIQARSELRRDHGLNTRPNFLNSKDTAFTLGRGVA